MKINSWTVFFMFRPYTTIHTTVLTDSNDVEESVLIELAKRKIKLELGIDVDEVASRLGENNNFGSGWITVEDNLEATEQERLSIQFVHSTKEA
jgi:hypothetical protein